MNKSFSLFDFAKRIKRPLILDGAMGSLLQQKGFELDQHLWSSIISITNPELIIEIHKDYIDAGADIITTNTFRTNPNAIAKSSFKINCEEIVRQSVELALTAASGKNRLVAGSNAPAEDCYSANRTISTTSLERNHKYHIDLLVESGVDFILNETFSNMDEILIVAKHCSKYEIPFIISLYFTDDLKLLSGESLIDVIKIVSDYNPISIGFNCIQAKLFSNVYRSLSKDMNFGFYLNHLAQDSKKKLICDISPSEFVLETEKYLKKSPSFIGGCCGTNPAYIKALRKFFDDKN